MQATIMTIPKRNNISRPVWPIHTKYIYKNRERIHPLQQNTVGEMICNLSSNDFVEKIIVFGSSVRRDCHVGSDIDLYVLRSDDGRGKLNPDIDNKPYDLWTNYTVSREMMEEIKKTGVVVYERGNAGHVAEPGSQQL